MKYTLSAICMVLVLMAGGIVIMLQSGWEWMKMAERATQLTHGKVIKNQDDPPTFTVQYVVKGVIYTKRYPCKKKIYAGKDYLEVGMSVPVYYDPDFPVNAYLMRKPDSLGSNLLAIANVGAFILMMLILGKFYYEWRVRQKSRIYR